MPARLIRRYKRFLADVEIVGGAPPSRRIARTRARCSGSTIAGLGGLARADAHQAALPLGAGGAPTAGLVGINTGHPNALVAEAIAAGLIAELAGYSEHAPRGELRGQLAHRPAARARRPAPVLRRGQERPSQARREPPSSPTA